MKFGGYLLSKMDVSFAFIYIWRQQILLLTGVSIRSVEEWGQLESWRPRWRQSFFTDATGRSRSLGNSCVRFGQDVLCGMLFASDIASSSLKLRCMIELMTSLHTVNFACLTFWYVFEELSYVLCTPVIREGRCHNSQSAWGANWGWGSWNNCTEL